MAASATLEDVETANKDLHSSIECNHYFCIKPFFSFCFFHDLKTSNRQSLLKIMFSGSLKLDHEACANVNCMLLPCREELRELRSGHHHKIVKITENTGKCFEEEYMVGFVFPVQVRCFGFFCPCLSHSTFWSGGYAIVLHTNEAIN